MADNRISWPSEVFRPVFFHIRDLYPRITARRAAKITKGVLAAQEALRFSMSRNTREENHAEDESVENPHNPERRSRII